MDLSAKNNIYPEGSPLRNNFEYISTSNIKQNAKTYFLPDSRVSFAQGLAENLGDVALRYANNEVSIPNWYLVPRGHRDLPDYMPKLHNNIVASEVTLFGARSSLLLSSLVFCAQTGELLPNCNEAEVIALKSLFEAPNEKVIDILPRILIENKPAFMAYCLYLLNQNPPNIERIQVIHSLSLEYNYKSKEDYQSKYWQYSGTDACITLLGDELLKHSNPERFDEVSRLIEQATGIPSELRYSMPYVDARLKHILMITFQQQRPPEHYMRHFNIIVSIKSPSSLQNKTDSEIMNAPDLLRMRILVPTPRDVEYVFDYFFSHKTFRPLKAEETKLSHVALRLLNALGIVTNKGKKLQRPEAKLLSRQFTYDITSEKPGAFSSTSETTYEDAFAAKQDIVRVTKPIESERTVTSGLFFINVHRSIAEIPLEVQVLVKQTGDINSKCMAWWARIKRALG